MICFIISVHELQQYYRTVFVATTSAGGLKYRAASECAKISAKKLEAIYTRSGRTKSTQFHVQLFNMQPEC